MKVDLFGGGEAAVVTATGSYASRSAEIAAVHAFPGDLIRRGHRLFEVDRIEITHGEPVQLQVFLMRDHHHRASGDRQTLQLAPDEIIRRIMP